MKRRQRRPHASTWWTKAKNTAVGMDWNHPPLHELLGSQLGTKYSQGTLLVLPLRSLILTYCCDARGHVHSPNCAVSCIHMLSKLRQLTCLADGTHANGHAPARLGHLHEMFPWSHLACQSPCCRLSQSNQLDAWIAPTTMLRKMPNTRTFWIVEETTHSGKGSVATPL